MESDLHLEERVEHPYRAPFAIHGSLRMDKAWKDVLENYGDFHKHQDFVRQARMEKNLPFAAHKYRLILDVNPFDEIAVKMRKTILDQAQFQYIPVKKEEPQRRYTGWDFTSLFLMGGAGMVAIGVLAPKLGSFIGVGVLLLTLTIIQRTFGYTRPRP